MQIYWWQGGVHIEPENEDERAMLFRTTEMLKTINVLDFSSSAIAYSDDEDTIISIN